MLRFAPAGLLRRSQPCAVPITAAAASAHTRLSFTTATRRRLQGIDSTRHGASCGVDEDRVARWCRRLWDITRKSTETAEPVHLLPRSYLLHATQLGSMAEGEAGKGSSSASPSAPASARTPSAVGKAAVAAAAAAAVGSLSESADASVLLSRLQAAIRGDSGRIPGVIVDDLWTVFDLLVPPDVQDDPSDVTVTPEVENNFFAFVSMLNELDFDLPGVMKASKELEGSLAKYIAQLRQLEVQEAESESRTAAEATKAAEAAGAMRASSAVTEQLMKAKVEVMHCCFHTRNVGAPLYYTWLRHTASMADGLRRLMHFRKLAHYFESLCKKQLKRCDAQLKTPAATAAAAADTPQAAADKLARQRVIWGNRAMEVGLIDSALSLLFHDFFSKEYLVMEELTWFTTPPSLLDQIMRAEGVHPFARGLDDMRYRLQPTHHRHLFAFLHPAVVEEPLIAVQVALTHDIASSVDHILSRPTPLADPANTTQAAALYRQLSATAETAASAAAVGKGKSRDGDARSVDGDVNTAIFYSINSAQSALRGMDMGNRLIKRVVREVEGNINASRRGKNLTPIHTFSTLSPIPLYVKWLAEMVATLSTRDAEPRVTGVFGSGLTADQEERLYAAPLREAVAAFILRHPGLLASEAQAVTACAASDSAAAVAATHMRAANVAVLRYLVALFRTAPADGREEEQWWYDHAFTAALEGPLLRSVATYLCTAKRRGSARISDPVGNFHVSNGATVYRLNFLGNATAQGSRESACVMVNYWYDLPSVSSNATEYEARQTVAMGQPIRALLE